MTADPLGALGVLSDPVRRAAYHAVIDAGTPIGRDEVAEALGVGRTLAAFHLDKLAAAGLLEVSFARRAGRSGPGAGRPAKLYQRAAGEVTVSLPPRRYDEAALVLAETLERLGADDALFATARDKGREAADPSRDLVAALAERGYEPAADGDEVRLHNCPFWTLAERYPPLVCGMNLAFMEGFLEGGGWDGWRAAIDPEPGGCCVRLSHATKSKNKGR